MVVLRGTLVIGLTERGHVLATPDWQEADKRNLHTGKRPESIPGSVADVEAWAIPTHTDQNKRMQGEQVRDEDISTPSGHHVPVEERRQGSPKHRTVLDGLDPEEEGKYQ